MRINLTLNVRFVGAGEMPMRFGVIFVANGTLVLA